MFTTEEELRFEEREFKNWLSKTETVQQQSQISSFVQDRNLEMHHKLQVFINTCLPQILRITCTVDGQSTCISNQQLWQRTGQEPITDTIWNKKSKWIGHTVHCTICQEQTLTSTTHHALDWNPHENRGEERPCLTWKRTLQADLKTISITCPLHLLPRRMEGTM